MENRTWHFIRELIGTYANQNKTLALAESCTGGSLAGAITEIPGASKVFLGGLVVYSNTSKTQLLGVEEALLREHGAVSAPCAAAMARGAQKLFDVSTSLSITGIAGPEGESDEKPLGTIWFGLREGQEEKQLMIRFAGARWDVRAQARRAALQILLGRAYVFSHGGTESLCHGQNFSCDSR